MTDVITVEAARRAHQILGTALPSVQSRRRLNFAAVVQGLFDGTFRHHNSPELRAVEEFERIAGPVEGNPLHSVRLPPEFLRDATAASAAGGGYLVPTNDGMYLPALRPYDPAVARATIVPVAYGGGTLFPKGAAQVSTGWQSTEGGNAGDFAQTFGQAASSVHTLTSHAKASRQLFLQSNGSEILALEILRSAATALGTAIRQGTGVNGQPTGVLNTSGIGTAAGTSLAYAALVAATVAVANANAVRDESKLAWVTTPDVAGLLKQRYRISGGEIPLWQGNVPAGEIESAPAFATKEMPAANAIYGDWSSVFVAESPSGAVLEVDPFTGFKSGVYAMRFIQYCDVLVAYPGSFYSLTAIT